MRCVIIIIRIVSNNSDMWNTLSLSTNMNKLYGKNWMDEQT